MSDVDRFRRQARTAGVGAGMNRAPCLVEDRAQTLAEARAAVAAFLGTTAQLVAALPDTTARPAADRVSSSGCVVAASAGHMQRAVDVPFHQDHSSAYPDQDHTVVEA